MGKSLGNAIDPLALAKKYGHDALRYFLLREIPFGSDGDFSEEKLKQRYESDLANGLGNLVSRVTNMVEKFMNGTYERKNDSLVTAAIRGYEQALERYQFNEALRVITEQIDSSNMLIDQQQPWELAKQNKDKELRNLLNELVNRVLGVAGLLEPFMPQTAARIRKAFQPPIKKAEPLFPRINT
jgi:methionyl-tRNA synthetase